MSAPLTHADLVLHALGRLSPRRREEIVAALARDPALSREAAGVATHLALYDRLPAAPEPPPFAALLRRLGAQPRARRSVTRVAAALAAVVLVAIGALLWYGRDEAQFERRSSWVEPGPGLALTRWGGGGALLATGHEPAELRLRGRTRVVLDRHSTLFLYQEDTVGLEGRAWFEVAPGAFRIMVAGHQVDVLGTAFELDASLGLLVRVVEGRVRASFRSGEPLGEAGPGETITDAAAAVETDLPGAFARRPQLTLQVASEARAGETLEVHLVLQAPRLVPVQLPGPAPVASAAWLAFRRPDGSDATVGLDLASVDWAGAGSQALLPGRSLTLEAGQRREILFRVPLPPGPPGTWRLSALYRPEGEAALASPTVPLVVR